MFGNLRHSFLTRVQSLSIGLSEIADLVLTLVWLVSLVLSGNTSRILPSGHEL